MGKSLVPGRVLVGFIGGYHLLVGLMLLVSGDMSIRTAKALAGWTIHGNPEMRIVGEILGCYILAFGLMMVMAAIDPIRGSNLINVGLVLIALRLLQRLVFSGKVVEVFQVPAGRHWTAFVIVLLLGLALLAFRIQLGRQTRSAMA